MVSVELQHMIVSSSIARTVCHRMFQHIFTSLEKEYAKELEIIRQQYPSEPVQFTEDPLILHWDEGIKLLRDNNIEVCTKGETCHL